MTADENATYDRKIRNPYPLLKLIIIVLLMCGAAYLLAKANDNGPVQYTMGNAVGMVMIGSAALLLSIQKIPFLNSAATIWLEKSMIIFSKQWRVFLLITASLTLIYVLWSIPQRTPRTDDYTFLVPFWIGAFLLYLIASWGKGISNDTVHPISRKLWIIIGMITTIAFLLRIWKVGTIPFVLSGDEAEQGMEALRVISGETKNPFHTGWLGVPSLSFYFNSITIRLLGATILGLRLPWVCVGTITILLTFLWVRRLQNNIVALLSAALIAVYHYHIHFSRLGSNQIADPFFMTLSLWLLYRAMQRQSRTDWVLTGAAMGSAFYFYAGARLTPVIILATLLYLFLCQPRAFRRQHGVGLLLMIGGFLFVAAPMLQYALLNPGEFNARLNQVGIFQSGWYELERTAGRTPLDIFGKQLAEAAFAFTYYPDKTIWYGLKEPLLTPVYSTLFLTGLCYATAQIFRFQSSIYAAPVAWWWGGMLSAGFLTTDPPNSQRLITLSIPVSIFIAITLWKIAMLVQQSVAHSKKIERYIFIIAVSIFAISSIHLYFVDFSPKHISGGSRAHFATEISPILNQLLPEHKAYFVGAPWMYWGFGTTKYLVGESYGIDMGETKLSAEQLTLLVDHTKPAVFIVLAERIDELAIIIDKYPAGQKQEIWSTDGRLYGVIYVEKK